MVKQNATEVELKRQKHKQMRWKNGCDLKTKNKRPKQ